MHATPLKLSALRDIVIILPFITINVITYGTFSKYYTELCACSYSVVQGNCHV